MNAPAAQIAPAARGGARQQLELARDRFLDHIRTETASGREPRWLARLRDEAAQSFAEQGLPTSKHEEWKHTSLSALARVPWQAGPARITAGGAPLATLAPQLPTGAEIVSLADAVGRSPLAAEHLGRVAPLAGRPFAALNAALWQGGAFVNVPAGTELPPLVLRLQAGDNALAHPAAHPRLLVVAAPRSRLALLVEGLTAGTEDALGNTIIEVVAGDGAEVEIVQLVQPRAGTFHIGALHAHLHREARLRSHAVVLGAALARSDVEITFAGPDAAAEINGVLLAGAGQTADAHTFLDHAVPRTTAEEKYHTVVAGRGHGVFQGRITIREDAQKADARQTSKSLLLDDTARMDARPQLEIHADDVRCVHGGAIGQLDREALFYLRARGLAPDHARALLVEAFLRQVTSRIGGPHRSMVDAALGPRLHTVVRAGEVLS